MIGSERPGYPLPTVEEPSMGNSTWGTSKPMVGSRLLASELPAPVLVAIPACVRPMSPPGAAAG